MPVMLMYDRWAIVANDDAADDDGAMLYWPTVDLVAVDVALFVQPNFEELD